MKHFDNDGVTVFGGIPFQSSYRHKLFGKIIKNVLASNAHGHPYTEGRSSNMTRKREHRMTVRLNGDEYTKVLSKIERSGLSKQEYILSSILNKKIQERLNVDYFKLINEVNHVGTNLNQIARKLNSNESILKDEIIKNQMLLNQVLKNLNDQIKGNSNGNN